MNRRQVIQIVLFWFIFACFIQSTAYAAIIRVKPNGNDANSGLSWIQAKKTVTAAINSANKNDEIWVAAGTYAENIQIMKEVAVYGGFKGDETALNQRDWGANVTTLNGTSSDTVVTITGGVGPNMRVDGFTITGGRSGFGGGISVTGSSPTIANNLIKLNGATAYGGGIFCSDSSPSIISNSILWNFSGDDGGGISCWRNSSPFIANNNIVGNVSNYTDGGSEFYSDFEEECQRRKIRLFVLPPKSPKLNGCVERAHRTHTEEFYEVYECPWNVTDLNPQLRQWEYVYNCIRPHQALNYKTPLQFLKENGIV
jgi:hypothetical protein